MLHGSIGRAQQAQPHLGVVGVALGLIGWLAPTALHL